jgi:predicted nucleic acid-binding protein
MTKPILVDTDVLVDFLRGQPQAVAYLKAQSAHVILSAVVVAELYAGVKDGAELQRLDQFLAIFSVAPVTAEVARAAGLYKRDYYGSHRIGLADAIVAATAETQQADLKTLNTKHFPMFAGLQPPYVKT